jgi:hypothetical protein
MAKKINLYNGKLVEVECLSCAIVSGAVHPDGGVVVESEYFHAHQGPGNSSCQTSFY